MVKDSIKLMMNVQEFIVTRRIYDNLFWDKYFEINYNKDTNILDSQDGFIVVNEYSDCIYIQDFVSHGSGFKLFNQVVKMSRKYNKPIEATVHCGNFQLLNVMMNKLKFKIKEYYGNHYELIREVV